MTGELSLTGQVLPIGGLREKCIAAKRYNIKNIIIPKQNLRDLDEIPDYVKKGISFYPGDRIPTGGQTTATRAGQALQATTKEPREKDSQNI